MKRYYTMRNPFYPSFKTLRKRWMKRERDREEAAIATGIFTAISVYNNDDNQN